MHKLLLGLAALASSASATPPLPPPPPPAPPPRLVVLISVDQLSSQLWERHRPHFTGGLARLAGGTMFRNASEPADPRIGAIGDLLKARSPGSLTVAVAGEQRAIGLAGAAADQRWTWDGARFSGTSAESQGGVIARANAAVAAMIATPQPPLLLPPACMPQTLPPPGAPPSTQRFSRGAGDANAFATSPALDGAVLAVAAALTGEQRLGSDDRPDLLAIDLAATGNVAERFGTQSEAMCLQLHSLDRDLAGFFAQLDSAQLDYAVVLTGARTPRVPILFWRRGMAPVERSEQVRTADIAPTIAAMLGLAESASEAGGRCLARIPGIACPPR